MSAVNVGRLLGWATLAVIIVLSVLPSADRPHSGLSGQLEHGLAYAGNAALFAVGYRDSAARWRLLLLLGALAGTLELVQLRIPGRTSEFAGFFASALGALLGMSAGAGLEELRRRTGRPRST
jgi:VanZ family protein